MELKFEVGKMYQAPHSDVAECVYSNMPQNVVMKRRDGTLFILSSDSQFRLWTEAKESGKMWMNIYRRADNGRIYSQNFLDRESADKLPRLGNQEERIACVKVSWKEGQGL